MALKTESSVHGLGITESGTNSETKAPEIGPAAYAMAAAEASGDLGRKRIREELEDAVPLKKPANEAPAAIKLLCPFNVSGSLIGHRGSVVNEMQSQTGARIKLSQNTEFFPGTQDRVVLVTGQVQEVHAAIETIVHRILEASVAKDGEMLNPHLNAGVAATDAYGNPIIPAIAPRGTRKTIRILIPASASGVVIGRGGTIIKTLSDVSNAKISLAQKDQVVPVSERIVTVTADAEENIVAAIKSVLAQLLSDPTGGKYTNMSTSYSVSAALPPGIAAARPQDPIGAAYAQYQVYQQQGHVPPAAYGAAASQAMGYGPPQMQQMPQTATTTVQIPVNEAYIGSIIGRAGSVIQEIMSYSGARVQVSQKGEYITGTQERIVSVTGTPAAVQAAQYVITEKVQNAALLGNSFR